MPDLRNASLAALRYIISDATAARIAMQGLDPKAEGKYSDQGQ